MVTYVQNGPESGYGAQSEEEALKYSQGLKSENGMNTGAYSNYVDEKEESEA